MSRECSPPDQTQDQRVASASPEAFELAIDALCDSQLRRALLNRASVAQIDPEVRQRPRIGSTVDDIVALIDTIRTAHHGAVRDAALQSMIGLVERGKPIPAAVCQDLLALLGVEQTECGLQRLLFVFNRAGTHVPLTLLVTLMSTHVDYVSVHWEIFLLLERWQVSHVAADLKPGIETLRTAVSRRSPKWRRGDDYLDEAIDILCGLTKRR